MLDIKFIRENYDIVKDAAVKKKVDIDIDELVKVDDQRKEAITEVDRDRSEQNEFSKKISSAPSKEEKEKLISRMQNFKLRLQKKEEHLKEITKKWFSLMIKVPNIPSVDTPVGPDESGNQVVRTWGAKRNFDFTIKDHS